MDDEATAALDDVSAGTGSAPPGASDFYDVIHRRRDVRAEFSGEPVDLEVLERLLGAAHAAPSVGLTQPWDFIVITDDAVRTAFAEHVQRERDVFADTLEGEAAERFAGIKIDGVLESSLSVVVTYDAQRGAPHVLGRHAIADAGLFSTCLAIQNLWLACTVEGWGLGWVSFYREAFLSELVGLPDSVRPVAWLCVGPVRSLQTVPDLERHGWRERSPLAGAVHHNRWTNDGSNLAGSSVAPAGGAVGAPTSDVRVGTTPRVGFES